MIEYKRISICSVSASLRAPTDGRTWKPTMIALLASASNAIIVGFQVRPSVGARKLAETEQIDIRLYSIIYNAINEIKAAMEGMLAPTFEEKIVANVEIRETFKIS